MPLEPARLIDEPPVTHRAGRVEGLDEHGAWRSLREFGEVSRQVRSHGFNTDADAITRALCEDLGLELSGAKILLLGAGGAGRTAALKLASESAAELFLVNRTRIKAEAVAEEIRQRHPTISARLVEGTKPPNDFRAWFKKPGMTMARPCKAASMV